jgi:hypothetical protein
MKDEDRDWIIYHLAIREKNTRLDDLVRDSGFSRDLVRESVERLEKGFLLDISGECIRALGVGESMVRCQCRFMKDSPIIVENGVIRARKPDREGD